MARHKKEAMPKMHKEGKMHPKAKHHMAKAEHHMAKAHHHMGKAHSHMGKKK